MSPSWRGQCTVRAKQKSRISMDFRQGRERAELKVSNLLKAQIENSLKRNVGDDVNQQGMGLGVAIDQRSESHLSWG
jgi:hypothetical protein